MILNEIQRKNTQKQLNEKQVNSNKSENKGNNK